MAAEVMNSKREAPHTGLTTVTRNAGMDEILPIIDRDGGVIVEDMINPETLRRLNPELDESIANTAPGSRTDDRPVEDFSRRAAPCASPASRHAAKVSSSCCCIR